LLVALVLLATGCGRSTKFSDVEQAALQRTLEALRQGDYEQATSLADGLAKKHPSASLLAVKGIAQLRAGQVKEAIGTLEHAQKLDPGNAEVAMARVRAYLADDKVDQAKLAARLAQATLIAETAVSRAIAAGSLDRERTAAALQRVGQDLLKAGQSTAALGMFTEAAVLDPKLATARLLKGSALYNLKAYARAVVELRAAIELGAPSSGAWKLIGHSFVQLGDNKSAREAYTQVLRVAPSDPDARNALARLGGQAGAAPPPKPTAPTATPGAAPSAPQPPEHTHPPDKK